MLNLIRRSLLEGLIRGEDMKILVAGLLHSGNSVNFTVAEGKTIFTVCSSIRCDEIYENNSYSMHATIGFLKGTGYLYAPADYLGYSCMLATLSETSIENSTGNTAISYVIFEIDE